MPDTTTQLGLEQSDKSLGKDTNYLLSSVNNRFMRIVLAVAETGNMSSAGKQLHLSPSAVSKAVKEVEKRLGTNIFWNCEKNLIPNEAGLAYIDMARRVINNLRDLEENITSLVSGTAGSIRIGVQSIAAQPIMVRAMADVSEVNPGIRFQLIEVGIDQLLLNIRNNKLDFGIGRIIPELLGSDIDHVEMVHEPHVIIISNDHKLLAEPEIDWSMVVNENWCLPLPGTPIRVKLTTMLAERNLPFPTNIIESNSLVTNLMLHQKMAIISLAQQRVAKQWEKNGHVEILPIDLGIKIDPMGLIWSNQFRLPPAADIYRKAIQSAVSMAAQTFSEALWPDAVF